MRMKPGPLLCGLLTAGSAQAGEMSLQQAMDFFKAARYAECTADSVCVVAPDYCGRPTALNERFLAQFSEAARVMGRVASCPVVDPAEAIGRTSRCERQRCVLVPRP